MKKEGDLFFKNGKAYLKETGAAYCGQYKVVFEFNDYCVFEYLNDEEIKRSIYTPESILQSEAYLHNNEIIKAIIFNETGKRNLNTITLMVNLMDYLKYMMRMEIYLSQ